MNIRHPLATAVAVALASAATAASTDAAVTADPSDYVLRRGEAPDSSALVGLTKTLEKSGVQALLNAKGNRKLGHKGGCRKAAAVPPNADWYCFNPGDTKTKEWIPQGVSGVSDAQEDELWGSAKPLLVSWYDADKRAPHKSVRVTFVNPANNTYRHVLLVWPYAQRGTGAPTYEPVGTHGTDTGIHAGGIAWYGNRLYVADTNRGVRVFDMRVILDLGASANGTTTGRDKVGLHGKTYYGYGYRYVMPQTGSWVNAKPIGKRCDGAGAPVHSYLSIDRSKVPDMLVSGEYCDRATDPDAGKDGRLGMWPLQSTGAEPGDPQTDGNGQVVPRFVNGLPDSEKALRLLASSFRTAVRDGSDVPAREEMALAATFAGMGFGNAGVHIPHANAYPIAGRVRGYIPAGYPADEAIVPHGMAVSLTAPAAFGFTFSSAPDRHLRAAELLGHAGAPSPSALPALLVGLMRDIGLPNGLSAVGYGAADVDDLVEGSLKQQRLLATAPREVTGEDLAGVFAASMDLW